MPDRIRRSLFPVALASLVIALSASGRTLLENAINWVASGGNIDGSGLYTAGDTEGTFEVTASETSGLAATASVSIRSNELPPPPPNGVPDPTLLPVASGQLRPQPRCGRGVR